MKSGKKTTQFWYFHTPTIAKWQSIKELYLLFVSLLQIGRVFLMDEDT